MSWEYLYKLCIKKGCSPSDFWAMTPTEVFVYLDAHMEQVKFGSLTIEDIEELQEMRQQGDFI